MVDVHDQPPPPAIDWESSFTGGYDVDTGEGNDPVTFDMDGYLIGGGADLFVLGIGEFIHLRGSAYFEMGRVVTVPLVSVVDLSEFESAFSEDVLDLINVTEKTLRFLNFGAQDVYAFVGIHGPHWITEDTSDLTSDIVFECDPDYSGACDTDPNTGTCATDDDPLDGHADAEELDACRAVINEDAIGIAVSALDFAFAMGTPIIDADPTRFYTLRASLDLAALIGLEDAGLTASLEGVEVELNIATPTISGFPILPVIDWEAYALTPTADGGGGCTQSDLDAGEPYPPSCEPFAVKTGRIDPSTGDPVVEYFLYDTLLIRAAVELARIDVFGVLAARGSLAFVLGPVLTDVELIDGTIVSSMTTMTIGGANLFGFIGVNGPHWTEDSDGNLVYTTDGTAGGTACDPEIDDPCELVQNDSAIGLAMSDLDFGLFVGASLEPTEPGAFVAADLDVDSFDLLGVPGVTATAILHIALNLGFLLSAGGSSISGINFKKFRYDEDSGEDFDDDGNTGETNQVGFLVETGDPSDPMVLDFDETFVEVQAAGTLDIVSVARMDGLFYLGIDLDAGEQELRLLALAEIIVGPDIGTSGDPLVTIGAIGVLILNEDGAAGDLTVNLGVNVPRLTVDVYARVIFNSSANDQTMAIPQRLYDYLVAIRDGHLSAGDLNDPGDLVIDLIDRIDACTALSEPCLTISGDKPNLVSGTEPDSDTIQALLGDDTKTISYSGTGPYVVIVIDGEITVVGFASAAGFGAVGVSTTEFELILDVEFVLGPGPSVSLKVGAKAIAEISDDGLFLDIAVDLEANLLSVFDLDVNGQMTIDTRASQPGTPSFKLILNGSVDVLRVITLDGGLTILVGGELGEDAWYIGANLSADLGPLSLSAEGFISSWGSFKLEFTGKVDLTIAGTGIQGRVTAHVSFCARPGGDTFDKNCLDDIQHELDTNGSLSQSTKDLIASFNTIGSDGGLNPGGRGF
ncbi:MAG: hypothetical protein R3324_02590, partial [Halobacteriales archaeon]|nr:hypothetical protein [Halobacteriales archaeon]